MNTEGIDSILNKVVLKLMEFYAVWIGYNTEVSKDGKPLNIPSLPDFIENN